MEKKKMTCGLTVDEKIDLVMGKGYWNTLPVPSQNIPTIEMADGPCGLRKQTGICDHMGWNESLPAVSYPCGSAIGSTWNRELIQRLGEALGEECHEQNVQMLLGPAINIKRQPLNGRNCEYYSEDPYLTGELAMAYISGLQSKGVGACVKHFACNNQEKNKNNLDTLVDEKTLREIYLYAFEQAICKVAPRAVMTAYNKLNGEFCSENRWLLKDILRKQWNYGGMVISDWNGTNDAALAHENGLDLQMPSGFDKTHAYMSQALKNGRLSYEALNTAAENVAYNAAEQHRQWMQQEAVKPDWKKHHQLAYEIAVEGAVLLKNDKNILPLDKKDKIAVIGEYGLKPRFQIQGSAMVVCTEEDIPLSEIEKYSIHKPMFAQGYDTKNPADNDLLREEAVRIARKADKVVLFVGLEDGEEGETVERSFMGIHDSHRLLIEACARVTSNIIVVLCTGVAVEMPWEKDVPAILDMHLGGQAMGSAVAALLFGERNPCGKLAETFPVHGENMPVYINYPDQGGAISYYEKVFVGYRYYDTKKLDVLYPFGHGLSYTKFDYIHMAVDRCKITDADRLSVKVNIKNTGNRTGSEIVELYIHDVRCSYLKPEKELKGFEKVYLKPDEEKTVTFILDKMSFAHFEPKIHDWYIESGEFDILIGSSSRKIELNKRVFVLNTRPMPLDYTEESNIPDILADERCAGAAQEVLSDILDRTEHVRELQKFSRVERRTGLAGGTFRKLQNLCPAIFSDEIIAGYLKLINHTEEI